MLLTNEASNVVASPAKQAIDRVAPAEFAPR